VESLSVATLKKQFNLTPSLFWQGNKLFYGEKDITIEQLLNNCA